MRRFGIARRPLYAALTAFATIYLVAGGASAATSTPGQQVTIQILALEGSPATSGDIGTQLGREFQRQHPNITVEITEKSYADVSGTAKLVMSGPNPPDILQHNLGYALEGPLVQAGLLLPLNKYARAGTWASRQPGSILGAGRFTADGKQWGAGNLYAVSFTVDFMGVYYNKTKLRKLGLRTPRTLADLQQVLQRAKAAGEVPIQLGAAEKYPAAWVFQHTLQLYEPKKPILNWIYGKPGSTAVDPQWIRGATLVQEWGKAGYFPSDWAALSRDDANKRFISGEGVFLVDGGWRNSSIGVTMGRRAGFMAFPTVRKGGAPVEVGSGGNPYSISAKSEHPDEAAAWLDFMMSRRAATIMLNNSTISASFQLVPRTLVRRSAKPGTTTADLLRLWNELSASNGAVPWLDYATPTGVDLYGSLSQQLIGNRISPRNAMRAMQADWVKFQASRQ
jgi:raffinose/stachyose/melibiose transport system substrate-binding protein